MHRTTQGREEAARRLVVLGELFPETGGFRRTLVFEVNCLIEGLVESGPPLTARGIAGAINSVFGTARNGHMSLNETVTAIMRLHQLVDVFTNDAEVALMAKGLLWRDVEPRVIECLPKERRGE